MIDLYGVGLGVIEERFNEEQKKVITNICDMNTEAKAVREITIKLKFKPDPEYRERCDLEAIVSSKLAPTKAYISKATVGIDIDTGEVDAVENMPKQPKLFKDPDQEGTVVSMRRSAQN